MACPGKLRMFFSKCTGQAMSVHAPSSSYAKTPVLPSLKGVTIKRELAYLGKRAVCIKLENKI